MPYNTPEMFPFLTPTYKGFYRSLEYLLRTTFSYPNDMTVRILIMA